MRSSLVILILLIMTLLPITSGLEGATPQNQVLPLSSFKTGRLDGWEPEVFGEMTQYRVVNSDVGLVLEAVSMGSASGLIKKMEVDLERTPFLQWSWKINRLIQGNVEQSRLGDDFPARLYVVVSGGMFFWKTRALNYVWSSNQRVGSHWPNPYSENVQMLAVESGNNNIDRWVFYKRNVREDLKTYLGLDVSTIHAIALMVDTDNTGQSAHSYFGDVQFTGE